MTPRSSTPTARGIIDSMRVQPEPGWAPPVYWDERQEGECMRQAVACVLGVHPRAIPWIAPDENNPGWSFWECYAQAVRDLGWQLRHEFAPEVRRVRIPKRTRLAYGAHSQAPTLAPVTFTEERLPEPGWRPRGDAGLWIAIVPPMHSRTGSHAVVMDGWKLHFDSNNYDPVDPGGRKRCPSKFLGAVYFVPKGAIHHE